MQLWGLHWHLAAVVGNDVPAAYFKMMQVAVLQLLGAVYLAILSAGVGFRLCIFPARYEFDTIPRRLFQLMQVSLLQLLAAFYLAIISAGVGFRLDT